MFKTETHLHVAEISPCSKIKAEKMIESYFEAGFKTVFVTDHLKKKYLDGLGDIPWEDKITIFMSGYYRAKHTGDLLGVNVLPAAEFAFEEAISNHYLVYGLTKEFLCAHPDIFEMGIEGFTTLARKSGLFVVQAHPFRDEKSFPTPQFVDAFEVYNTNPRHLNFPEKTYELAIEHGLYMTSGSDAHRPEDLARGGIITETEIKTANDYIETLKSRKLTFIKEQAE